MRLDLPEQVTVVEVGPRDGLQSLDRWVPTDAKVALITRLVEAGFRSIEVTAFARPDVIPNLRDAEEVVARIPRRPGVVYRALVPNAKGAERAAAAGVDEMSGLVTVSEAYSLKNQNMTVARAIEQAILAFRVSDSADIPFTVAVGMAFFCPYEGRIPEDRTLDVVGRLRAGGIRGYILAGSLGMEDPRHVNEVFQRVAEWWPDVDLGFHVHNLAGMGTANVVAALLGGATSVEGSIAGIGGGVAIPRPVGAVGNIATEDLVHLLNEMGVNTGLDTGTVVEASREIASLLGVEPASYVSRSGTRSDILKLGQLQPRTHPA